MKLSKLFNNFFNNGRAGGILLLVSTIISLLLANSFFQSEYLKFWDFQFLGNKLTHWINDGLMAIFFLFIGLELEREIYTGELSNWKKASFPFFAALGGMIVPAGIYLLVNWQGNTRSGAGIPMATDIAFAVGLISLLGNRVPIALKIFIMALAVIDDLGAILVIAIFYTDIIVFSNLFISLAIFLLLLILNRCRIRNIIPYIFGGILMWYFMLHSGIHATISGILLAFAIPFGDGTEKSPSYLLQHFLHKPVVFFILPLFALANTCIVLGNDWQNSFTSIIAAGVFAGLVIGKPLGIWLFSFLSVYFGFSSLPEQVNWKHILGAGFLGGIGFTMSIFITLLAFNQPDQILESKIAILISSFISGALGFIWLKKILKANS